MKTKFRAFDKKENKMYYPCCSKNDTSIIFNEWGWEIFDHFTGKPERLLISWIENNIRKNNNNAVLMKFTDFEDININEIYENDLIENCDTKELQIVYWNKEKGAWY